MLTEFFQAKRRLGRNNQRRCPSAPSLVAKRLRSSSARVLSDESFASSSNSVRQCPFDGREERRTATAPLSRSRRRQSRDRAPVSKRAVNDQSKSAHHAMSVRPAARKNSSPKSGLAGPRPNSSMSHES